MNEKEKTMNITMHLTEMIDPFPHQARKRFNEAGLEGLAASILAKGVRQPLQARPSPTHKLRLELIAGERRLRAAKLAGLKMVPVIVEEMSDLDAEELMLTENLQREDLTPVEEADGYCRMLSLRRDDGEALYTQETLALKLSKSLSHVKSRVKLRACPEAMLDAVERGEIGVNIAAQVGRIPDPKAREIAAKRIMRPEHQVVPLNLRQTLDLVREEFMARITGAGFDAKDASLVPLAVDAQGERISGGSCEDCPYRSGKSEDIQDQLAVSGGKSKSGDKGGSKAGIDPWLCARPSCLARKQDAAFSHLSSKHLHKSKLNSVLSEAEAKKTFSGYNYRIPSDNKYVELDSKPEYSDFRSHDMGKWSKLLKGIEIGEVLAQHPKTRCAMLLVNREDAKAAIKKMMKADDHHDDMSPEIAKRKAERGKELREEKLQKLVAAAGVNALLHQVEAKGVGLEGAQALFEGVLEMSGSDGMAFLGKHFGVTLPKGGHCGRAFGDAILKLAKTRASTVDGWLALTCVASIARSMKWNSAKAQGFLSMLTVYGIDKKRLESEAKTVLDAEKKDKVKPLPKKKMNDGMGHGETGSGAPVNADAETVYDASDDDGHEAELGQYHCDRCGTVCDVEEDECDAVERMKEGEFVGSCCDFKSPYHKTAQQAEWEVWTPPTKP